MAADVCDSGFRTWQAARDLIHHVPRLLGAHLDTVARASGVAPREVGDALRLLRDDHFVFRRPATFDLLGGLEAMAIARGDGFDLAVVILLADLLQSRQSMAPLTGVWAEAVARLPDWPATLRAAVANGLVRAGELGLVQLDEGPNAAACLTRGVDEISEHLLQIARSMRPDELLAVAEADHGQDVNRHLDALQQVISLRDGIFLPEESRYPSRVVELVARVPGSPGHDGCTAILLLNVLQRGDLQGGFDFRWQEQGAAYCDLKPSKRDPILAGIRYLYETDRKFMTDITVDFDPAHGFGLTIPVVDDL